MSSTRRKTKDILATIPVELVESLGLEVGKVLAAETHSWCHHNTET